MASLATGSSGAQVKRLQEVLNHIGPGPALTVDGIFGPKTKARVVALQQRFGLKADGIVGPVTSRALVSNVLGPNLRPRA